MSKDIKGGEEFVQLMFKLEAEELCGLSKILGVRLLTDDVDPETKKAIPRDGSVIIEECIDHFASLNRADRRWILRYLKGKVRKR